MFGGYGGVLRSFAALAGSVGTLVPAAAFFSDLAPPYLPLSAMIVAAVSAATLINVALRGQRRLRTSDTVHARRLGRATRHLVIAVVLITLYGGLLNVCTVEESGERFQIGFYKSDLGLTAEGREVKALHPAETPREWMANDGLFTDDGPAKLWEPWSRFASFASMFLVLLFACALWSGAWGTLATVHLAQRASGMVGQRRAGLAGAAEQRRRR